MAPVPVYTKWWFTLIGGLLLGFVACILFGAIFLGGGILGSGLCKSAGNLVHLNPEIVCGGGQTVSKSGYVAFQTKLQEYIAEQIKAGQVSTVAVYFRDLQYGPTFGINDYVKFSPASLLKLPMMLSYLNRSEDEPGLLSTKVYYEGSPEENLVQSIKPAQSIQPDMQYSISDLLKYMIKYSDNKAYYVLLEYANQISPNAQMLRDTYIDLGIIDPQDPFQNTITVKSYASIFTQLYNSSYFSKQETSEKALQLLAETDFADGLVAGVPQGIQVAHKFGERFDDATGDKQLHDCGIVYYPKNPYLLCVMTRGKDMPTLAHTIAEVSRMVYVEFNSRKL